MEKVRIIGVHPINNEVHLLEIMVNTPPSEFDVSDFTQDVPGQPRENWQAAYDEYYLSEQGDVIIGDFLHAPRNDTGVSRLAFFMYFLNFDTPLITPFGKLKLPDPTPVPSRLSRIIDFEEVD